MNHPVRVQLKYLEMSKSEFCGRSPVFIRSLFIVSRDCWHNLSVVYTRLFLQGELVPVSISHWARGRVHVPSLSQGNTLQTTTPKENVERSVNVFWLWEEARVPRENPCTHWENLRTSHRKTPGRNSNAGPFYCKATVPCWYKSKPILIFFLRTIKKKKKKMQLNFLILRPEDMYDR